MPPSRSIRKLCLVASLAVAGACSAGGSTADSPTPASPPVTEPVVRTTVEFGPGDVVVAEIERIGADARAFVRMPDGLVGEEVLMGDQHYVRMPKTELVLGVDRWIHTDLSDPAQRRYHEANPAGFIDLADLADRRVGDVVAGQEVVAVRRPSEGSIVLDLGHGRTIAVRTEELSAADVEPISAPDPDAVVAFLDLPELMARAG